MKQETIYSLCEELHMLHLSKSSIIQSIDKMIEEEMLKHWESHLYYSLWNWRGQEERNTHNRVFEISKKLPDGVFTQYMKWVPKEYRPYNKSLTTL